MVDIEDNLSSLLHVQLGMLIIEGRVFKSQGQNSVRGNHCPAVNQTKTTHACQQENPECQKANSQQRKIDKHWKRSKLVVIDVVMVPDCVHHTTGHLLERWKIEMTKKSCGPMLRLCLLQAVNSTIYFSQMNSWWSTNRHLKHQNFQYRIYGEPTASVDFCEPPHMHKFPCCENVQVTLQSLPRQTTVPEIYCPECADISSYLERGRRMLPGRLSMSTNSSLSSTGSSSLCGSPCVENRLHSSRSSSRTSNSSVNRSEQNMVITFDPSTLRQDSTTFNEQNDSGFIEVDSNNNSREMEFKATFDYSSESDDSNDDYIIDGPLWSPGLDSPSMIASPMDRRVQSLQERFQEIVPRRPSLDRIMSEETNIGLRTRHSSLDSAISNFEHLELQNERINPPSTRDSGFFSSNKPLHGDSINFNRSSEIAKPKKTKHKNLNLSLSQNDIPASYTQEANVFHLDFDQSIAAENLDHSQEEANEDHSMNIDNAIENFVSKLELNCMEHHTLLLEETSVQDDTRKKIDLTSIEDAHLDENANILTTDLKKQLHSSSENIDVCSSTTKSKDKEVSILRSPPSKLQLLNQHDVHPNYEKNKQHVPMHKVISHKLVQNSHMTSSQVLLPQHNAPVPNALAHSRSAFMYEFDEKMPRQNTRTSRSKCKGKCMKKNGHVFFNHQKPKPLNRLLGNFEESILHNRLPELGSVEGFAIQLGASGAFCPDKVKIPLNVKFFEVCHDSTPSPYLGTVNLQKHLKGKRGYHIPNKGTLQMTLFNPNESVVKMFVMLYNFTDMPSGHRTFIRQRIYSCPVTETNATHSNNNSKYLKYCAHLWVESSKTNKIYLHGNIKVLFSLASSDWDSGNTFELKSETLLPDCPKYSPKK